jgi:Protein kinase domain
VGRPNRVRGDPVFSAALHIPGIGQLEPIERGGSESVFRGWQPAMHRSVAVKVVDGSESVRIQEQMPALGRLSQHPHVVPVYEGGLIEDGHLYLVMPYLTGGSLQDRLVRGPIDVLQAVNAALAVADALSEAHRIGILHGNVKPANILFTAYGVPQLTGFGVARPDDITSSGGGLAGDGGYTAPEVLSGGPATVRSDVYSLGATLYSALRGTPLFGEDPEPLEAWGIDRSLADVVRRATAQEPADRHPDAAALGQDLARVSRAAPDAGWGPAAAGTGDAGPLRPSRPAEGPGPEDPGVAPALGEAAEDGAVPPSGEGLDWRHDRPQLGQPRARPELRRQAALAAAAVLIVAGAGIALASALSPGPAHRSGNRSSGPASSVTAAPPGTVAPGTTPPTSRSVSAADTGAPPAPASDSGPPSAGGATSAAQIPPSRLENELRSYYALVNQHQLGPAWTWLSPRFQAEIGQAYYQQFWNGISQVQVLGVTATNGVATVTLHYVAVNGQASTEPVQLGFSISPGRLVLIDTDRATGT